MPRPTPTTVMLALLGLLAGPLAAGARADALKISGFWIEGVTVHKVEAGVVLFTAPSGADTETALSKVEGIKLDAYPRLAEAGDAFAAADYKKAIATFSAVRKQVKEDWLKQFIDWHLYRAYDSQKQGVKAVGLFVDLAAGGAEPHYLREAPIATAATLSNQAKADVAPRIERALQRVKDEDLKAVLGDMLAMVQPDAAAPGGDGGNTATAQVPNINDATQVRGDGGAIILPERTPDSPTIALLKQGEFSKALASAERDVKKPNNLAASLFFKGLAQLALADAAVDADEETRNRMYMDAGLSFMRVVVYFDRTPYYPPLALLEVGYVHEKIGDMETAQQLYDRAAQSIDAQTYPSYHKRLVQITGQRPE